MTITITRGCISANTTFDGVSIADENVDIPAILDHLLPKLREQVLANHVSIERVIELFQPLSDEWSEHPCDQCGDTTTWTTWEI